MKVCHIKIIGTTSLDKKNQAAEDRKETCWLEHRIRLAARE